MKPSQRNAIQATVKAVAQEISRLECSLAKFDPGTLPRRRLQEQLDAAKSKHAEAAARLSTSTKSN
jgi:hypothetical protein